MHVKTACKHDDEIDPSFLSHLYQNNNKTKKEEKASRGNTSVAIGIHKSKMKGAFMDGR